VIAVLPPGLRAAVPAELRGLSRDGARLCVIDRHGRRVVHTHVSEIGEHLRAGDVLVVNSSRTIPAALTGECPDGSRVQVRPWVRRPHGWDVIVVSPEPPHAPVALNEGAILRFASGFVARVSHRRDDLPWLWHLEHISGDGFAALLNSGEPIRYSYASETVSLEHLQTVFAAEPGSAETPSAGRHLTWQLLLGLRRRGVDVVDIVLHTGLSSTQDDAVDATHPLLEEWYSVGQDAAAAINAARRVIAVGTSVVRALETVVDANGRVAAGQGWTSLRIGPATALRASDALLSGLHEANGSHLAVVGAFVDRTLLESAYAECVARRYLWHEFGDAMLVL
jgi:S-adenosylmethionine:tRNA ribosyltransferase-isomerase